MMASLSNCNRRLIQQSVLRIDSIYTQRISRRNLYDSTVRLSSRLLCNSSGIQRYHASLAFRFHDSISKNSWISNPTQISPAITIDYTRQMSTKSTDSKEQPTTTPKPRKVTTLSIAAKKRKNQKIIMVTAYDYPSAVHVDRAGMDIVLVGDSCAMVELGFETTQVKCTVYLCLCFVHIMMCINFAIISTLHILATPIHILLFNSQLH